MSVAQRKEGWWRAWRFSGGQHPSETEKPPEKRNDAWWSSFALRWALLFSLFNYYDPLRWLQLNRPGTHIASVSWLAAHIFGLQIPPGFWELSADALGVIPFAFIWTIFDRRNRINRVLRELLHLMVRYSLAAGMIQYGADKVIGDQGTPQPAPLEWIRPLGEISTREFMWTWLGYSPSFQFFAGVNESLGGLLLFFRRTTLLGALLVLPVTIYVTVLDLTFNVGPVAARATFFAVAAFYLVAREWRRLARVFVFRKPTAPPLQTRLWSSRRLALARRGLWIVVVAVIFRTYVVRHFRENADIGQTPSALYGAYRVERFVQDGRVLPAEASDAERWREVAINWFGDYVRIRRMDDAELLWSAYPGYSYRFGSANGSVYEYGDYRKVVAKTAGLQGQLRFRELPDFRSPHPVPAGGSRANQFFTINFVRDASGHLSFQGRIDGAEISADLLRINDRSFEFLKSREGLP